MKNISKFIAFIALLQAQNILSTTQSWDALNTTFSISQEQFKAIVRQLGANPCTDDLLVRDFQDIQKKLGIKTNVPLYEINDKNNNAGAYYQSRSKIVCVNKAIFDSLSKANKDFVLYHELRHYLQNSTNQAKEKVKEYVKNLNISFDEAVEYDADMFALEQIAKNNCLDCMQEIYDLMVTSKGLLGLGCLDTKTHDSNGYITYKAIEPYIGKLKKEPSFCYNHTASQYFNDKYTYGSSLKKKASFAASIYFCQKGAAMLATLATIGIAANYLHFSKKYTALLSLSSMLCVCKLLVANDSRKENYLAQLRRKHYQEFNLKPLV